MRAGSGKQLVPLGQQPRELVHHVTVELGVGIATQFGERILHAPRGSVAPVTGHGVEGIHHGDDARAERDVDTGQPRRIAGAVPSLVMMAHQRNNVLHAPDLPRDRRAERRVFADLGDLLLVERILLRQQVLGEVDGADVMQDRREANGRVLVPVQLEPLRQPLGVARQRRYRTTTEANACVECRGEVHPDQYGGGRSAVR